MTDPATALRSRSTKVIAAFLCMEALAPLAGTIYCAAGAAWFAAACWLALAAVFIFAALYVWKTA
jgi:lysylphosphatidylglycerol synthetase-like protein (DUF2156 family)